MADKDIRFTLPLDSILDLLFQIKNDRQELAIALERAEQAKEGIKNFYEGILESKIDAKQELEYEILKLKSKICDLEHIIAKYEKLFPLYLPKGTPDSDKGGIEDHAK